MADKYMHDGCREAVCIDAGRVYDSCADKDCIENMRVYFLERDQMIVDHATSIRARCASLITVFIDVEALPFNRGYYACDLTFFFEVSVEACSGHVAPGHELCGVGVFRKKVILYGSEGNVKVFSSEYAANHDDRQELPTRNMPRCVVQVAEPVLLGASLVDVCEPCCCPCRIPDCICNRYNGTFMDCGEKAVTVTLGIFTIVQLIRNVQMLVPVYDFCMPSKECCPNTDSPCELFYKMNFPVGEFFPPAEIPGNASECSAPHGHCGCNKRN